MSDLERAIVDAARKIRRGCDCEYDYRCGRCEAVVGLHEAIAALDERIVSDFNQPTPTKSTKLLPAVDVLLDARQDKIHDDSNLISAAPITRPARSRR